MQKPLKWSGSFFEGSLVGLLLLYLVSTSFLELPLYPAWGHRLQPPELVFGLAICTLIWGILYLKIKIHLVWNLLDLAVAIYLLVQIISAFANPDGPVWLELLGKFYLLGVYLLFKTALSQKWISWKLVITGMKILAAALIITTSLAYLLLLLGRENALLVKFVDYPYFGTLYRVKGSLQTPSMYISLVNWCFLFLFVDTYTANSFKSRWPLLGGLMLCAILSFSKAVLLLFMIPALIGSIHFFHSYRKFLVLFIAGTTLMVYLGITNLVYVGHLQEQQIGDNFLGLDQVPAEGSGQWLPSSYLALKKAAWIIGNAHFSLGVGPGNFNRHLRQLQTEGSYPAHLPIYDPHSVWFGAFAETGFLGLISICSVCIIAFWRVGRLEVHDPFHWVLLVWLIVFTIEGFNGDLMNFRHYWLTFGLLAARLQPTGLSPGKT